MNGTAMSISGLDTTSTALCTCAPAAGASSCPCTTTMTGIPTGRDVYALKAEYQCNTGASLLVKVRGVVLSSTIVAQPPNTCQDSCQGYHTLFSWYDIGASSDSSTSLLLEVEANNVAADYCGAGHHLKVVFTLFY